MAESGTGERDGDGENDHSEALDSEEHGPASGEPVERELVGLTVLDSHGDKVGKIEALLVHGEVERPNWARVKLDMLGIRSALIPLKDAQDLDGDVRIVYEREWVKAAPEIELEGSEISDEDANQLHNHYGLERVAGLTTIDDDDIELPRETRDAKPPSMGEGPMPKPPLPDMPEDEQPSPVKKEEDSEGEAREREPSEEGEHGESHEAGEGSAAGAETAQKEAE